MGNIIIKKTTPSPVKTFEIRNLIDLNMMLEVPVVVYAIPESSDDEAMGMKVEGNKSSFDIVSVALLFNNSSNPSKQTKVFLEL